MSYPCIVPGTHSYTGCRGCACPFYDPYHTLPGCWAHSGERKKTAPLKDVSLSAEVVAVTPGERLQGLEEDETEPL